MMINYKLIIAFDSENNCIVRCNLKYFEIIYASFGRSGWKSINKLHRIQLILSDNKKLYVLLKFNEFI